MCGAETQAAQEADEEGGDPLHFSDMAGVFITLAVGVAAGMVVLLLELIYVSCKYARSRDAQVTGYVFFSPITSFYSPFLGFSVFCLISLKVLSEL